jgi:hypothetical protein
VKTTGNIAFITTLLLISFIDVIGQEEEGVKVGDRVRVTSYYRLAERNLGPLKSGALARTVGTVVTFEADTVVLKTEGQATPFTVPLALLKKLEVSRGPKKSRALAGAGIGFLLGFVIGSSTDCGYDCPPAQTGLILGGIGAPLGTLSGAAIGAGERWEEVPL